MYLYAQETALIAGGLNQTSENISHDTLVDIIVSEALGTSEIEGEYYNELDLRSSVRNILNISKEREIVRDKGAESISCLMIEARKTFDQALTEDMIFSWHNILMKESRLDSQYHGKWRSNTTDTMQIISGPIGKEKIHYEAPPSNIVASEMQKFINWFNSRMNLMGPIRAAISHLYFEIIHPFEDGNGRIGRIISEKALSQDLKQPVLISISSEIMKDKKRYYDELAHASRIDMDITQWVNYFSTLIYNAQKSSRSKIEFILKKAKFWRSFDDSLNERQNQVISSMFKEGEKGFEGGISAQKYMRIVSCSKATATRDLADLLKKGAIIPLHFGGRSTSYNLYLPS